MIKAKFYVVYLKLFSIIHYSKRKALRKLNLPRKFNLHFSRQEQYSLALALSAVAVLVCRARALKS